jgi:nucleoside-diphosphate-sugar epimerase
LSQRDLRREQLAPFHAVIVASGRNRVRRGETLAAVLEEESAVLTTTLEWCRELGIRVVLLSSADVCGMREVIEGSSPAAPRSEYGQLKLRREEVALSARAQGANVVVLRLAAVHGPGKLQTRRLVRLARRRLLVLPGRLDRSLSLVTVKVLTSAIISVLSSPVTEPVIAVGSGYVRADLLFQALAREQGRELHIVGLPLPSRAAQIGMTSRVPLLAWISRFASSRAVAAEAGVPAPTVDELAADLVR